MKILYKEGGLDTKHPMLTRSTPSVPKHSEPPLHPSNPVKIEDTNEENFLDIEFEDIKWVTRMK